MAAAHVLQGRSVLQTRDEAIASVAAPPTDEAALALAALPAARKAIEDASRADRVGMLGRLLAGCLVRFDDPRASLTPDEVAQFVALLDDASVRDTLLRRVANTDDGALRLLINELARRTPAGQDAEVTVVLAVGAYLAGDGVLSRAALDRCTAADPAHPLAMIVSTMLDHAVHPRVLRDALSL